MEAAQFLVRTIKQTLHKLQGKTTINLFEKHVRDHPIRNTGATFTEFGLRFYSLCK